MASYLVATSGRRGAGATSMMAEGSRADTVVLRLRFQPPPPRTEHADFLHPLSYPVSRAGRVPWVIWCDDDVHSGEATVGGANRLYDRPPCLHASRCRLTPHHESLWPTSSVSKGSDYVWIVTR